MAKSKRNSNENIEYENMPLSEIIHDKREELGISQRELARRLKIDNSGLAKIEKGIRKKPSILILKKLSMFLFIDLGFLMTKAGYNQEEIDVATSQNTMYLANSYKFLDDFEIEEQNKLDVLLTAKDLYTRLKSKEIKLVDKNGCEVKKYNKLINQQLKNLDEQIAQQQRAVDLWTGIINKDVKK